MQRTHVKTLEDFIKQAEKLASKSNGSIWFRGVSRSSHQLLPKLYRPGFKPQKNFNQLEQALISRFELRSIPYRVRDFSSDLEKLFFMQHFGVPTRLLDWTENALTALFFAVTAAHYKDGVDGYYGQHDAVVWVLDPYQWNQMALARFTYNGGPLDPNHEFVKPYEPSTDETGPLLPIAIHGAHNSQRIVAQQGTFVLFGFDRTPMEQLYNTGRFPAGALSKLVLRRGSLVRLRESVLTLGVTEGTVFPDLEGLSIELSRQFGFTF